MRPYALLFLHRATVQSTYCIEMRRAAGFSARIPASKDTRCSSVLCVTVFKCTKKVLHSYSFGGKCHPTWETAVGRFATIGPEMKSISYVPYVRCVRYVRCEILSSYGGEYGTLLLRRSVETFRKNALIPSETQKSLFCRVASGNRFLRNLSTETHILHGNRTSDYSLLST
jgi:hypothetical protein